MFMVVVGLWLYYVYDSDLAMFMVAVRLCWLW